MIGRKGISPMIATVLLIAFTVAVGGVLSLWLTTLSSTQTTTTGAAAEKQVLCSRSVLEVTEVYYAAPNQRSNVTVSYTYGTESLTSFNIFFVDSARLSQNTTVGGTNKTTLQPGDSTTWNLLMGSLSSSGTLQSVRVVSMCQTNYPVSGECKSGQACMKQY